MPQKKLTIVPDKSFTRLFCTKTRQKFYKNNDITKIIQAVIVVSDIPLLDAIQ
ncbi:hypothetical protein LJR015_003503 [Peribacillus frigoritolerans]|uniref:hypothetical protein n=1 Tax=Peribacillus frigoritolerans TaxID=450367 RepID=UPI003ECCC346